MRTLIVLVMLFWSGYAYGQTCAQADLTHPNSAALNWVDNAANETGFILERKLNTGAYTVLIAIGQGNVTSYTDSTIVRSTVPNTYTYRVKATNTTGDSPYSNEACITFAALPAAPPAPSGLTVAAISSQTLRTTWNDIDGETAYELEGKTAKGQKVWNRLTSVVANTTTYDWTGLKRYTSYCFRLRGLASTVAGVYSEARCATTSK